MLDKWKWDPVLGLLQSTYMPENVSELWDFFWSEVHKDNFDLSVFAQNHRSLLLIQ